MRAQDLYNNRLQPTAMEKIIEDSGRKSYWNLLDFDGNLSVLK